MTNLLLQATVQKFRSERGILQGEPVPFHTGIPADPHFIRPCICLMSPEQPLSHLPFFLRLSHPVPSVLAWLNSPWGKMISNTSNTLSNDSLCHINSFSDIYIVYSTHTRTRVCTHTLCLVEIIFGMIWARIGTSIGTITLNINVHVCLESHLPLPFASERGAH